MTWRRSPLLRESARRSSAARATTRSPVGPRTTSSTGTSGGGAGNDVVGVRLSFGAAAVPAERGNDAFQGGPGDDTLRPGTGGLIDSDKVFGGPGVDTATYDNRSQGLRLSLDGLQNDG